MAVDYKEGRRLLAKAQEAAKAWSDAFNAFDPDAEKLERRMAIHRTILGGWMADHAEALLNPVSAAPSPAGDELKATEEDVAYLARNMSGIPMREWNAISNRMLATARALSALEARADAAEEMLLVFMAAPPDFTVDQARAAIAALRQRAAMDRLLRMDGELYDVPTNQEPRND